MESYSSIWHELGQHNSIGMKRYLDPDGIEHDNIATKRPCLPPSESLTGEWELQDSYCIPEELQQHGFDHPDPMAIVVDQLDPDTCFGVIVATATSTFKALAGVKQVPVTLEAGNTILKLSFKDTGKYAGIIKNDTLARILREFTVKLDAKLVAPTAEKKTSSKKSFNLPQDCAVRIIVYGLAADLSTIGSIVGDSGFYFQHPLSSEYDGNMQYRNPHYLLRPGSQMPILEEVTGRGDDKKMESDLLDESSKGRFMRLFDEAGDGIIETDIEPSGRLRSMLKGHQFSALARLVSVEAGVIARDGFPSLWEPSSGSSSTNEYWHRITGCRELKPKLAPGGILADEMGLGKTLSMLALICRSLDTMEAQEMVGEKAQVRRSRTTLIVTPNNTQLATAMRAVRQICSQDCRIILTRFSHIHPGKVKIAIYHGSDRQKLPDKLQNSDVVLTTYETMRRDWTTKGPLFAEVWHRVVLDEAHHIRTRSSQTFKAACEIRARYRWCLTGTPIHNSLDDYAALLSFVGVPFFMDKSVFDFWIAKPIKEKSPHGLQRLGSLIKATCLRRTKKLTQSLFQLPDRHEQTVRLELSPEDRDLYTFFSKKAANIASGAYRHDPQYSFMDGRKNDNILTLINVLRLICDHGEQLLPQSAVESWKTSGDNFMDWQKIQDFQEFQAACDLCGSKIDDAKVQNVMGLNTSSLHAMCQACHTSVEGNASENEPTSPDRSMPTPSDREGSYSTITTMPAQLPPKLKVLIDNLHQEQSISDHNESNRPVKSVVFSSWAKMISLTQRSLEANGFVCARIDGQTSLEGRSQATRQFNNDPKCTVMLATIGSAGEGIDLTAANNVHLLEPHWNPMVEAQAIDRVHRIGQLRTVRITRYMIKDTIETYVQWVQRDKLRLIQQSLDSQDIPQTDINDQRWKELRASLGCALPS
ncbi:SMARCA3-like protein-like protein [Cladobotryum mycophilum]|uniref:SMARCA3-like protein-like protein n=1 Tax=Cladobotryum mycophilum TaxID=491253 RepID=A0ABR0S7U3_9HYPO